MSRSQVMKIRTGRLGAFCVSYFLSGFAHGTSQQMCLAPEFQAIAKAEEVHARGQFESARKQFLTLTGSEIQSISARAAYRLAEIQESLLTRSRSSEIDFQQLLGEYQKVRSVYLDVTTHGDMFWSRRAAYRLITLIDETLLSLQDLVWARNAELSLSPFKFLFRHTLADKALQKELVALEKERAMLEETLLSKLKVGSSDPPLATAILDRQRIAISLRFAEDIVPPWNNLDLSGVITKQGRHFYLIEKNTLRKLNRKDAISGMRLALLRPEDPLPFAFSLASLVDEKEALPVQIISFALGSPHEAIRLAGLYAAQKAPAHELTHQLLSLWPKDSRQHLAPFATAQELLYGHRERVLLALSTHFALGRGSTLRILEWASLPEAEKAWLLQFRKDKNSAAYAEILLQNPSAVVKIRTQNAMRAWHS